ncbi:molybdate transport system regulatory protein [Natronorubrum sediminis]|uniref:Molybdate transport system regulatory protein n=1 Tax=Natronorubrum sediminis TaxID=640943 RepID=A0A1H6FJZ3_9EURY|nr:TOBE domain-containing protein [Natronorubrum sediminis]SEH11171.1 molybdate transport system regulatory protein [Natronorubrum sediminis]
MTFRKEYTTKLSVGDVTLDRRDIEMLDAIDQHGSLHKAADELGRSYARLQRRVVEIEDSVGQITERRRGGTDGGGTDLTQTAHELRHQFNQHDVELDGVSRVTESVFTGTVQDRNGELATVDTNAGSILALVPDDAHRVQVAVRSDAVVLENPIETSQPAETSLRNQFTGEVVDTESGDAITKVTIRLSDSVDLHALITKASADRLSIRSEQSITASFKATAARAIRLEPTLEE